MVRLVVVAVALLLVACATSETQGGDAAIDGAELDAAAVDATDAAPTDATDAAIDAPPGPDACVASAELCNGLDDNCNLLTDETFPTLGTACTAGNGACQTAGVLVCSPDGTGVQCDAVAGTPTAETCNAIDDDCDTATDETFALGGSCDGADADLCTEGAVVCSATGGTTCSDLTGDRVETCNALDDDCDTRFDEGFNLGMQCDGGDTDACQEGVLVCNVAGAAVCNDATASTAELCNGLDDDCRNGVDDGFAIGAACTVGVGACQSPGTLVCNGAGTGVVCNATAGTPTAETCGDGIDQDCSGADVTCPVNDRPTGALNISGGGTFTVDLATANNDQDFSGTSCGLTGGRDVYYSFSLPAAETVYLDTFGSSFDTTLRLFAGSCTALGALQSCFDDSCSILQTQGAIQLAAGAYCLVVDQYSSSQTLGALVLQFTRGGRGGTALPATSGTVTGTSCSGINASTAGCQMTSTAQDAAYFFTVCPATTRAVTASTCSAATTFDSVVYLRRGAATSADLGCDDDSCGDPTLASVMPSTNAVGPGLFWLTVDGYQAACGPFSLTYAIN